MLKIEYYKKNVYGIPALYVKDEQIAKKLFNLTGRKTITHNDMNILATLFKAEFVQVLN